MYKRDYVLIAETINAIVIDLRTNLSGNIYPTAHANSMLEGVAKVVKDLAIEFDDVDNWFDPDKFTRACGF